MNGYFVFISLFLLVQVSNGQSSSDFSLTAKKNKEIKGWFYGSFGWHRIYYTRSTIDFENKKTADFDFRLIKARAADDNDLRVGKGIDAPQWSLRFGCILNRKTQWGIEWSYDHAKYILKQGQRLRIDGYINGYHYSQDTTINKDFIEYEHTDGANYYMMNFLVKKNLRKNIAGRHAFDLLIKAGAGMVIPRTDSRIMGNHYNEHYHISGYVTGVETGLRYEFIKNIFAELSAKGVYANYSDVLLFGGGRASQQWLSGQYLFTLAYQVPLKKRSAL